MRAPLQATHSTVFSCTLSTPQQSTYQEPPRVLFGCLRSKTKEKREKNTHRTATPAAIVLSAFQLEPACIAAGNLTEMDPTQSTSKKPLDRENHVPEVTEADLAQAFKDLARGEKTAQALESNLTNLEQKIDDLLASFEESERQRVEAINGSGNSKKNASGRQ